MIRTARGERVLRLLVGMLVVLLLSASAAAALGAPASPAEEHEIRLGREGAAEIERKFKVVKDEAIAGRVSRIGATVAAVSDRAHLPYSFKVVEDAQANAVALPGGFVYVTTGLLKFVRSDHELAAVIAHEVAHAARAHGLEMSRRTTMAAFVTILVAIVTRDPALAQGAQIASGGLLSGYTRDLERDADLASIGYMIRTRYSPVAVLTVLERILRREQFTPGRDMGAYASHPQTRERVQYVESELHRRRIPIARRIPANYLVLDVAEDSEGGVPHAEILVNGTLMIRLADIRRIREAAEVLDRLFDADLEPYEVSARETIGGWGVFARGLPVIRFTAGDIAPGGGTVRDLATTVALRLRVAIDEDIRKRRLEG